jgi:MFS family permease
MVMPEMIKDLHLTYAQAGVINGVSQASSLITIPLAGYLTHRIGGLRLIVACQLVGCILLAALSLVQEYYSLLAINFLIRGWPVVVWIPLIVIASEHISMKWRATMLTAASSGPCFFIFIDGILSSFFLEHYHWRSLWQLTAFVCLFCCCGSFMTLKLVKAWDYSTKKKEVKHRSNTELIQWMKARSGVILISLFAIIGFTFMSFQVYLASFLRHELGVGLETAAVMWSVMGISGILGGVSIGIITDRFGVKVSFGLVFTMAMLSTVLICLPLNSVSILAMAVLFGVSQAAVYGLGPAYISKTLSTNSATAAFSSATMVLTFGAMVGNFIGGWSEGEFGSFTGFYISLGVFCVIGAVLSFGLKSERR